MFERRIGYPPAGTNQPDWMWKKPTVWTWIADAAAFVALLSILALGIWGLVESFSRLT